MNTAADLKEIEKKTYLAFHEDGLLEMMLGVFIIAVSLLLVLNVPYLVGILPALGYGAWRSFKEKVTRPRIGYVDFNPKRKMRIRREKGFFRMFFGVTVVLGLALFLLMQNPPAAILSFLETHVMLPFGLIIGLGMVFLGAWRQMPRFYAFAALLFICISLGPLADIEPPWYFGVTGVVMLVYGIWMLIRFLSRYSIESGEDHA